MLNTDNLENGMVLGIELPEKEYAEHCDKCDVDIDYGEEFYGDVYGYEILCQSCFHAEQERYEEDHCQVIFRDDER